MLTLKLGVIKKQIAYKNIFLTFLIVSWLFELTFSLNNQRNYVVFPKILTIIFLGAYYFSSVNKPNTLFAIFLMSLLFVGLLFSFNDLSPIAMYCVTISRISLVFLLLTEGKKLERKLLKSLFFLFIVVIGAIVYLLHVNSDFFYASAIATFFLVVLLTISFAKIVMFGFRKGNLEFFCAMFIFLLSDVLFGSKKLTNPKTIHILLSSTCYLLAYYLITKSVLKRDTEL